MPSEVVSMHGVQFIPLLAGLVVLCGAALLIKGRRPYELIGVAVGIGIAFVTYALTGDLSFGHRGNNGGRKLNSRAGADLTVDSPATAECSVRAWNLG